MGLPFDGAPRSFSLEAAIGRLTEELKKPAQAPNPPVAFDLWNRVRRKVALASYAIYDEIRAVFSPFLEHRLRVF
jgi:hypothetical protein